MEAADAIAWPFGLGGNMGERLDWLTDVLDPPYGPAQTRKLRTAPRTFLTFDGLESAANRRWMETLLHVNGAGLWHAPLAIDTTETTAPALGGATVLQVDTTTRRFVAGGNAIIQGRTAREFQILTIDAVDADSITVTDTPLGVDWPAGSSITPTIGARLTAGPQIDRFTGDDAPYAISFRADEPMDWPADFGEASYRGLPVFEMAIDWGNDPAYQPDRRVALLDSGIGRVRVYDQAGMVMPSIRFDMTLQSRALQAEFRSLIYALSGRWQPIWVPTFAQDVAIQSQHFDADLNIEWMGISDWPIGENRRDLRIETINLGTFYRRVIAATAIDADTERLTLDSALPVGFDPAQVTAVSFMALCRQDSDTNMLRVWSRDVLVSELQFEGIINDL